MKEYENLVKEKLEALKNMPDDLRLSTVTNLINLLIILNNLNVIDKDYFSKTMTKLLEVRRKLCNDTWLPY